MIKEKSQSKYGCFLTGCLGAVAALILVVVVVAVGGYYVFKNYLNDYTDTKPLVFQERLLSAEEDADLKDKWTTFKMQKSLDLPTDPMELDADQLNHLIRTDPDFSPLKDKIHVEIENTTVRTDVSIPASMVKEVFPNLPNLDMIKRRYFNAREVLNLGLVNNELAITLESLDMAGGKKIPDE